MGARSRSRSLTASVMADPRVPRTPPRRSSSETTPRTTSRAGCPGEPPLAKQAKLFPTELTAPKPDPSDILFDWLAKPWVVKKKRNAVQSKVLTMGSASEQKWTELQAVKMELLERSCMLN